MSNRPELIRWARERIEMAVRKRRGKREASCDYWRGYEDAMRELEMCAGSKPSPLGWPDAVTASICDTSFGGK